MQLSAGRITGGENHGACRQNNKDHEAGNPGAQAGGFGTCRGEDAGEGYEYLNGFYARREITCEVERGNIRVVIGEQEGTFVPTRRRIRVELRGIASEPKSVQLGESPADSRYDPELRRLTVELPATASSQSLDLTMDR